MKDQKKINARIAFGAIMYGWFAGTLLQEWWAFFAAGIAFIIYLISMELSE